MVDLLTSYIGWDPKSLRLDSVFVPGLSGTLGMGGFELVENSVRDAEAPSLGYSSRKGF
jgi:hypothetical protein